jgi:hypothetical protein
MVLIGYSGAPGTLIYKKNLKAKILCQTPFNGVVPKSSRTFDSIEGADDASQEDNDEKGEEEGGQASSQIIVPDQFKARPFHHQQIISCITLGLAKPFYIFCT